jgi:hypothetical protein
VPTAIICELASARLGRVGGDGEPAAATLRAHDLPAGRLVDRDLAALQQLDLALVDVEAQHVVADVGEAGAGDEADVAGSDDADLHAALLRRDCVDRIRGGRRVGGR